MDSTLFFTVRHSGRSIDIYDDHLVLRDEEQGGQTDNSWQGKISIPVDQYSMQMSLDWLYRR